MLLLACRDAPRAHESVAPIDAASASTVAATASLADAAPPPRPSLPRVATDWCTEGLEGLTETICYVVPDGELRAPRTLLIYLHGVVAPTGRTQAFVQGVVAKAAQAHGIVAIVPRGRRGIGPEKTRDWWAWPTTGAAHARYANELIAEWMEAKRRLEASLGAPFERVWIAGSSNGAYFLTVLALKGQLEADAWGAISGGSRGGFTKGTIAAAKRAPFYVGYGSYDDAKTDPIALGRLLDEAGWPHKTAEHRVGHGANDVYMTDAFAYWEAAH